MKSVHVAVREKFENSYYEIVNIAKDFIAEW